MGRIYHSAKQEADYLKKIKISTLKKYGFLKGGYISGTMKWEGNFMNKESGINIAVSNFEQETKVRLGYSIEMMNKGIYETIDYNLPLTTTDCNFGGRRYWFICNLTSNGKYCGRRVGNLYKLGKYFACRHCHNLSYDSRNENRRFRDYALFYVLTNRKKIDLLKQKMKRRVYAGKPTKMQIAINKLYDKELPYALDIYKKKILIR